MEPIIFAKMRMTGCGPEKARGKTVRVRKPAVRAVVRVRFGGGCELDYFNDRFDLKPGDAVFVDGRFAGQLGRVVSVSRHFKIRPEDYKRVIGLADTRVSGRFCRVDSYLVTFDRRALPYGRFRTWVLPPEPDGEYLTGYGDERVDLSDRGTWPFDAGVLERGAGYFRDGHVRYLSLSGGRGRAVVDGSRPYEVEFQYKDGVAARRSCTCPCGYPCKHEAAVLLQLAQLRERLGDRCAAEWSRSGYFAAVSAPLFFSLAVGDGTILRLERQ